MEKTRTFGCIKKFIEPCILLLLSKSPSHGYGLMDDLEKHCGHKVDIGNLYRTLRQMEKHGWVTSDWQKNSLGPDKRTYHLSKKGEVALHEAVSTLRMNHSLLSRFLTGYKKIFARKEPQ